jgi:hypothetical protein
MARKLLLVLAVAMIGVSLFGGTARADFVLRETLRPRDADRSVRSTVRNLSDGSLALNMIAGVHHPRTIIGAKKNPRQANAATIYARISDEVPPRTRGGTAIELDHAILSFPCDQLEDRCWICSARSVQVLVDPGSEVPQYFYLER